MTNGRQIRAVAFHPGRLPGSFLPMPRCHLRAWQRTIITSPRRWRRPTAAARHSGGCSTMPGTVICVARRGAGRSGCEPMIPALPDTARPSYSTEPGWKRQVTLPSPVNSRWAGHAVACRKSSVACLERRIPSMPAIRVAQQWNTPISCSRNSAAAALPASYLRMPIRRHPPCPPAGWRARSSWGSAIWTAGVSPTRR